MILLKRMRLINWYAFSEITEPIGQFTLIAGKNGNGKSVLLDAIKYAAYGDTVFNKSSEVKGSRARTISSYTRGLLDATANTYIRPADKVPNVYSHIALEYYDDIEEKSFVLGTVIETAASNNTQTLRYVLDKATLDDIEHTYKEGELVKPYSARTLRQRYKLQLLDREDGLKKFTQMTGLKLDPKVQLPIYLRKLRGVMTYDPAARIDSFIRESVLEGQQVDFTKLIDAKNNIERLNTAFSFVENELNELNGIIKAYDDYNNERNRLLTDDIKLIYKQLLESKKKLERLREQRVLAEQQSQQAEELLQGFGKRALEIDDRLIQARADFRSLDASRAIEEEKRHLQGLKQQLWQMEQKCQALEHFQAQVNAMLQGFANEQVAVAEKAVLASLCSGDFTQAVKAEAISGLKQLVAAAYDKHGERLFAISTELKTLNKELERQERILRDCEQHINDYSEIADYVGLRNDINREFVKRSLNTKACFACEYVIGLKDEAWRDAAEAFLGRRRYTILVEPQYYDIADDVLNKSQYRYAHLFNTKLLMSKEINVEEDSLVHQLEIKNLLAQQYFNYQLGRMHAVPIADVRKYENAISAEGRVSVAMDSYFLPFNKLRFYYLGQKTFELNKERAQKKIAQLQSGRKQLLAEQQAEQGRKQELKEAQDSFKDYTYDAHLSCQSLRRQCNESETQLQKLELAQKNNSEFVHLSELIASLEQEKQQVQGKQDRQRQRKNELTLQLADNAREQVENKERLAQAKGAFREYEKTSYAVLQKAVEAYDRFVANGCTGTGGTILDETRMRLKNSIEQHKNNLLSLQLNYNNMHAEANLPVESDNGRATYAQRYESIKIDNLQEIRQKLAQQTQRYEDIFKNEFVLKIYERCEQAKRELREINRELAELKFSSKYQFDVHYVNDGSDYERILAYARYLAKQEQLGSDSGGLNLFAEGDPDEGAQLEQELKSIINRIISQSSNEEVIHRFGDYRNYMTYEVLITNSVLDRAKLSRQTGFNSGAEVQIPYLLILLAALLLYYKGKDSSTNCTRLVFIDEPFAKMDPGNVKIMLRFMKAQGLQVIFCSPDKTETIGNECDVVLIALRVSVDCMRLSSIDFIKDKANARL